jgi:hypothetical protein
VLSPSRKRSTYSSLRVEDVLGSVGGDYGDHCLSRLSCSAVSVAEDVTGTIKE